MCLPISWCMIYEHTCPHLTECSSVFDQKLSMTPMPHPFYSPGMKNVFKGKHLQMWKRWNQKMVEALKGIKINWVQNYLEQWKKISVLHQMESTLKVTEVQICNNKYTIFISKFWLFGGLILYGICLTFQEMIN